MKVFWSWQGDHPGKISRHFVRDALDAAIKELNEDPNILEPDREVELDHDRKGVPGSPDLARTILDKISKCSVFVADVTPVGAVDDEPPIVRPAKRLINSNVAIELGFALGSFGDSCLIMLMNEHYGTRTDLPFDLAHKAGPIVYRLAPDAIKEKAETAKRDLTNKLKIALREILDSAQLKNANAFVPTPSIEGDRSRYFDLNQPLIERQGHEDGTHPYHVPQTPLFYLRVMPSQQVPKLKRADAREMIRTAPQDLPPLYYQFDSTIIEQNQFGVISCCTASQGNMVLDAVQLFLEKEIWGFNALLLEPRENKPVGIPSLAIEQSFSYSLPRYLKFATDKLGLQPPFRLEAGATGIRGYRIFLPHSYWSEPIIQDNDVIWEGVIDNLESESIDKILLDIFETFFDAAGEKRPEGLYSFPGEPPGSMPKG